MLNPIEHEEEQHDHQGETARDDAAREDQHLPVAGLGEPFLRHVDHRVDGHAVAEEEEQGGRIVEVVGEGSDIEDLDDDGREHGEEEGGYAVPNQVGGPVQQGAHLEGPQHHFLLAHTLLDQVEDAADGGKRQHCDKEQGLGVVTDMLKGGLGEDLF